MTYALLFFEIKTLFRSLKDRSEKIKIFGLIIAFSLLVVFGIFGVQVASVSSAAPDSPDFTLPLREQEFSGPMPKIEGKAPEGSRVLVFIDRKLNGVAKVKNGEFVYYPFLPLSSGRHVIALQSQYQDGTFSQKSEDRVIRITPNPSPAMLKPEQGSCLGNDRAWVGGIAKNDSLIRVFVDGIEVERVQVRNHPSGDGSFGVEIKNLPLGAHTVSAIARDRQGKDSFSSNVIAINVKPPTPTPVLKRPVVNADSGIERPFIAGLVKNGLDVFIVIDKEIAHKISASSHSSGTASFAWQPENSLSLGGHTIEAFSSDNGKLSNNSKPVFWQVGKVSSDKISKDGSAEQDLQESEPESLDQDSKEQEDSVSVIEPKDHEPLTVRGDLGEEQAGQSPIIPDNVSETKEGEAKDSLDLGETSDDEPEGRILADDEKAQSDSVSTGEDKVAKSDDDITEITPGAVVRDIQDNQKTGVRSDEEFTFNTSLVIGVVILVFLLLSILVWYIQEKRAELSERVVNIFKEDEDAGSGVDYTGPIDVSTGAAGTAVSSEKQSEDFPEDEERKKEERGEESDNNSSDDGDLGVDADKQRQNNDDSPPPPPPMF